MPTIAAEVWSPSNWPSEQARKARDYARAGCQELWGVFPDSRSMVQIVDPTPTGFATFLDLEPGSVVTSPLLEGFELPVDALFER